MSDIMKKYHISSGLCQTIINTYGRLNLHKKLKVEQRVQHVINDTKVLNNLIEDYQFMKNADIYEKYNIHKNGLYYILDKYKVPRKKDAKDLILQTVQVQEWLFLRKSVEQRIQELKNKKVYTTDKEETPMEKVYTFEEFKQSLINDNTSDFIDGFDKIDKDDDSSLLVMYIDDLASEGIGIPKGNYIALNEGTLELDDSVEIVGGNLPRGYLERSKVANILFRVGNFEDELLQQEIIRAINNNVDLIPIEETEGLLLSDCKVEYLELVDKHFFDNRIDEILKNYNNIQEPNKHL